MGEKGRRKGLASPRRARQGKNPFRRGGVYRARRIPGCRLSLLPALRNRPEARREILSRTAHGIAGRARGGKRVCFDAALRKSLPLRGTAFAPLRDGQGIEIRPQRALAGRQHPRIRQQQAAAGVRAHRLFGDGYRHHRGGRGTLHRRARHQTRGFHSERGGKPRGFRYPYRAVRGRGRHPLPHRRPTDQDRYHSRASVSRAARPVQDYGKPQHRPKATASGRENRAFHKRPGVRFPRFHHADHSRGKARHPYL